ncbi:MAG: hypothetical protein ACK5XN_05900 [Bacteroidota bacterium]|jgi:hypothetical protein
MAKQKEPEEMRPIKGRFTKKEFIRIARPIYKDQTEAIFEQFLKSGEIEPIGVAGIEGKVSIFSWRQGPGE